MKLRISEKMDGFFENDIRLEDAGVVSADRVRELTMAKLGISQPKATRRPGRKIGRVLLVAATVVLALSAAAVAVYQYGFRDAVMEAVPQRSLGEEMATKDRVSLNGFKDSPEYQAYLEWESWNETWNQENPSWFKEQGKDDAYYETDESHALIYQAYSREQADKLDEIIEKYGLTLHTARESFYTEAQLCAMLGIEDLFDERFDVRGEYLFNDGTFKAYADAAADGQELGITMFNAVKGSITMISGSIPEDYEEWNYVTPSGIEVVFVANEEQAIMIAGLQGTYVHVSFDTSLHPETMLTREMLESLADGIDLAALDTRFDGSVTAGETQKDFEAWVMARESAVTTDNGDETADLVLSILGNYYLDGLPEGTSLYQTSSHVPDEWERFFSVRHHYETPTASVSLYYRTLKEGETEVDVSGYVDMGEEVSDCTVNEYEGRLISFNGGDSCIVTWLDRERELVFEISSSASIFTPAEALALAESVTAADADMDASGPEGRDMRIALHQEEIDAAVAAEQVEYEALVAETTAELARAKERVGVYTIEALPQGFEQGSMWTNGEMETSDWFTRETIGYRLDVMEDYPYPAENETLILRCVAVWDMHDDSLTHNKEYFENALAIAEDNTVDLGGEMVYCTVNGYTAYARIDGYYFTEDQYIHEINVVWLDEARDRVFNLGYSCEEGDEDTLTLDDLIAIAESVTEA